MHVLPGTIASSDPGLDNTNGTYGIPNATIGGNRHGNYGITGSDGTSTGGGAYKDTGARGGVGASLELRKLAGLPGGQSLIVGADVSYESSRRTFSADASNIQSRSVGTSLFARYASRTFYTAGKLDWDWGNDDISNAGANTQSSYSSHGFESDLVVGKLFDLSHGGISADNARLPLGVLLADVSGHIGYSRGVAGSYADSAGNTYGTEIEEYWTGGGRVRLISPLIKDGVLWVPFVGGTLDRQFDYNHNLSANGANYKLTQAGTFVGAVAGVDVTTRSGATFGLTTSYRHSSDQDGLGGTFTARLPF